MRLKSVIALLKFYLDVIINRDGVFSQPCYPRQNKPIDQCDHATVLNILLDQIKLLNHSDHLKMRKLINFITLNLFSRLVSQIVWPMYNIQPS